MGPKDIIILVLIIVNIVANSLIIYASGNILPTPTNSTNTTNTTNFYLEYFNNNLNIVNNINISSNQNEIKKFDLFPTYGLAEATRFFKKAHKGLYFLPIFAFLFIALLFFSYFVDEEPGGENPLHGFSGGIQGNGMAGLGICLAIVFLFIFILILLLASAIGKKYSRILGASLQMIFSLICVILGAVQGNKDGIKKFVLITVIVGGIDAFFNLLSAILMCFDLGVKRSEDNNSNNYSNLSKNDSSQNNKKEISDAETPTHSAVELKTANSDNENLVSNPTP